MTKHIVSTLSATTDYVEWDTTHGVHTKKRVVTVKGGALVASNRRGDPTTPEGVITHVSDDDAKFLSEHGLFKEHQERGVVKTITINNKEADTVAQSMSKDDRSRPKTPKDVKEYSEQQQKKDPDVTGLQAVTNKGK